MNLNRFFLILCSFALLTIVLAMTSCQSTCPTCPHGATPDQCPTCKQ